MDPTTCYENISDALASGDFDGAAEHCSNLIEWIERGGFLPQQLSHMSKESALVALSLMASTMGAV